MSNFVDWKFGCVTSLIVITSIYIQQVDGDKESLHSATTWQQRDHDLDLSALAEMFAQCLPKPASSLIALEIIFSVSMHAVVD